MAEKLSVRLEDAQVGVHCAAATGNERIITDAVNKLLDASHEAARIVKAVEDAPEGICDDVVRHPDGSGFVAICGQQVPDIELGKCVKLVEVE